MHIPEENSWLQERGKRKTEGEEFHNLQPSLNILRAIQLRTLKYECGYVARMGEMRTTHRILVGIHERLRKMGIERGLILK